MKKVYFLLADGFEETEAITPWDMLKRAGAEVTLVSIRNGLTVRGSHGLTVLAEKPISDVNFNLADLLVLPGGGVGTENLSASFAVLDAVRTVFARGALVSAICAAPSVLGKAGVLTGKKATCYPSFEKYLTGATYTGERMVRDGNILTAAGMGVSAEFGLALVEALFDKQAALKVRDTILSALPL